MIHTCVFYEYPIALGDVHKWISSHLDRIVNLVAGGPDFNHYQITLKGDEKRSLELITINPFEALLNPVLCSGVETLINRDGAKLIIFGAIPNDEEIRKHLVKLISGEIHD